MEGLTCYTIGHSRHTIEQFIGLVKLHGIDLVADVRSIPYSRHASQFNRNAIEHSLIQHGIAYEYLGDMLGGRSPELADEDGSISFDNAMKSIAFQQGLDTLVARLGSGLNTTIMCAEKDPLHCHRFHLISRALDSRGIHVVHLLADGSKIDHQTLLNNIPMQMTISMDDAKLDNDTIYRSLLMKRRK